jgi:hypothetical protein
LKSSYSSPRTPRRPLRLCVSGLLVFSAFFGGVSAAPQNGPAATGPLVERVASFEREIDAGAGMILRLTAGPHGGVQVASWRERKIRIEARIEMHAPTEQDLDALATAVSVSVDPSPVALTVTTLGPHDPRVLKALKKFPDALKKMPWRVDYLVWVPSHIALDVKVTDGDTLVEEISGYLQVNCARGDIRLVNVNGTVVASAGDGDVEIKTRERGWRNGTLDVVAPQGNISLAAPRGFNANLAAPAIGGPALAGAETADLGTETQTRLGTGGAEVTLAAGGKLVITIGAPPE